MRYLYILYRGDCDGTNIMGCFYSKQAAIRFYEKEYDAYDEEDGLNIKAVPFYGDSNETN